MEAIEKDIDALENDAIKKSNGDVTRTYEMQAANDLRSKYDSITDSLGTWNTGLVVNQINGGDAASPGTRIV